MVQWRLTKTIIPTSHCDDFMNNKCSERLTSNWMIGNSIYNEQSMKIVIRSSEKVQNINIFYKDTSLGLWTFIHYYAFHPSTWPPQIKKGLQNSFKQRHLYLLLLRPCLIHRQVDLCLAHTACNKQQNSNACHNQSWKERQCCPLTISILVWEMDPTACNRNRTMNDW